MNDFLDSNVGKYRLKIMSSQVVAPQVAQTKTQRRFAKSSTKTDEVTVWRSLAGQLSHVEMQENSNRGLEHVMDLHQVCASVSH
jgi:hypothetical protein